MSAAESNPGRRGGLTPGVGETPTNPQPTEVERQRLGWETGDGVWIEPDAEGRWPAVYTTEAGKTIVAGSPCPGNPDLI